MENKINELEVEQEIISLNSLSIEVQEIFGRELSIPRYYDEKILYGGVDKKWCGLIMRMM